MDHGLINCASCKQKITCDLCGVAGHFKRSCPRRNEDPDNSTKKRKVSKEHQKKLTADTKGKAIVARAATTQAAATTAIADVSAAGNAAAPALQHLHNTRSKSTSTPIASSVPSAVPLCKHCGLPGHKMTTSKHCLLNPKRLLAQQGTDGSEDRMDTDNVDEDGSASMQN
ncbi:hypothetical protein [Parasitella parasitica]|uniref:CCHC-type domain-containing protein n=1 Tax=Parasitella parasitica TaxID=35722 RepID=A0A0B7NE40_9FUNG|nr:hypothetical protein [Parasitella parasitica]